LSPSQQGGGFFLIERGFDAAATFFEDMGIYHGCVEVFVAEEFLDGTDIVTGGK